MKSNTTPSSPAPATESKLFDKKKANLESNTALHFKIGLVATLIFMWLIVEFTTVAVHEQPYTATISTTDIENTPLGPIKIVYPIETQKAAVSTHQPVKKVSLIKPPVITPDVEPQNKVDHTTPAVTTTTLATTAATSTGTNTTSGTVADIPATNATVPMSAHLASEAPLFPGCSKSMDNDDRLRCFNEKIQRFVQKNFDTSIANKLDGQQVKFTVVFTIDHLGDVVDIYVKSKEESIEKEAKRLLNKLPDMTPGKLNGKTVHVQYALPIVFNIY